MESPSVSLIADYLHAHPRVISLANELQKMDCTTNYFAFSDHMQTVESEKDIFDSANLCLLGQSRFDKLLRFIPSRFMKFGWPIFSISLFECLKVPYVIKSLIRHKEELGDVLFVSYSPLSVLIGGAIVGRIGNKMVIIDWRDLYLDNHNVKFNFLRKLIRYSIFKFIDFLADRHFTVSEGLRKRLVTYTKKPVHILKNGSNRLVNAVTFKESQTVAVRYFGSVYYGKQPLGDFMSHLEALAVVERRNIQLEFYGTNKKVVNRVISDIGGFSGEISIRPRLSYESFLKEINHSGVNLVLGWIGEPSDEFGGGVLPTKFWECYSSDTPLLVYAPSDNDELRRNCAELNVRCVSDSEGIREFLEGMNFGLTRDEKSDVSFRVRAEQLIDILDEIRDVNLA